MSGVIIFPCLLLACNVKSVSLKLGKGTWIMIMTFCFLIVINFFFNFFKTENNSNKAQFES